MGIKKIVGLVLLVAGIIVLVLSLTANVIGLGGAGGFGFQQTLGTIGGAIGIVAGLALILWK